MNKKHTIRVADYGYKKSFIVDEKYSITDTGLILPYGDYKIKDIPDVVDLLCYLIKK